MQEKSMLEGLCNRILGAYVQNGHGMITNKRFVYSKHKFSTMFVMGALVNLTKGEYEFDIPASDIASVEETKRLFDKILVVNTKRGEQYSFFFTKREEWKIAFNNLMSGAYDNAVAPEPAPVPVAAPTGSAADELLKFKTLLDEGLISREEFDEQKARILSK